MILNENTNSFENSAIEIDNRENIQDNFFLFLTQKILLERKKFLTEIYIGEC